MKLYVPRELTMPVDVKSDEHVLDLKQWMDLQAVLEDYKSFDEVLRALSKNTKKCYIDLRYPALALKEMPDGSVGDWLITVVNIFGDEAVEGGGKLPAGLPKPRLLVRMAEEMDVTERVAKTRLLTLMHGGYLEEQYANVLFPVKLLMRT